MLVTFPYVNKKAMQTLANRVRNVLAAKIKILQRHEALIYDPIKKCFSE